MNPFVRKVALFFGLAAGLYASFTIFLLPPILRVTYGPSIEEQLTTSFANAESREYAVLILGNSRVYSGVNPDQLTLPAFNFAHNNDSFNQMYYKLQWVLQRGKELKAVVVGVDYFQFSVFSDTRNYVYAGFFDSQYMADYKGKPQWATYYRELLRPYKLRALVRDPIYRHDLKANGQFIRRGEPDPNDFIRRSFDRLEIQEMYFKKILETCAKESIQVFLCMPPLRDVELRQYDPRQVKEFNAYISTFLGEHVSYLDYSTSQDFEMEDYIDFSHLGEHGADKFSKMLSMELRISQ